MTGSSSQARASSTLQTPLSLQLRLNDFNRKRLTPLSEAKDWEERLQADCDLQRLECRFVEGERALVSDLASQAPLDSDRFIAWFEALKEHGPGQGHPLFPWLAHDATLDQMVWFLRQEVAGEAGFEDLVAITQVKLPARPKLEMARNYWDEMGQGHASGMHGPMLERLARELDIDGNTEPVWESLALGNLMVAMASHRHYTYQSIGALGVIELTAPGRAECVNAGLKRLGVAGEARRYFALHATLDVRHSIAWNREVLRPLVETDPRIALSVAEGALMRLRAGERCFERYARELGLGLSAAQSGLHRKTML